MKLKKIQTNYLKKEFLKEYKEITLLKNLSNKEEFKIINIYPNIKYQHFIGFGGAFTEATAYNFSKLSDTNKLQLLKDYFSEQGLNYNLCRTTINSCDFALNNYTYLDRFSKNIKSFSIKHDKNYIIPMIKSALSIKPNLKLIATPWSPPAFMKDNNNMNNGGKLLPKYREMWAQYILKFLQEYKKENINIDFITIQNEPNALQSWESCLYTPEEMAEFIQDYILPIFEKNKVSTKILLWDHNKDNIVSNINRIFQKISPKNKNIFGIGFHWYTGDHFENLSLLKQLYPDKILINTERCTGYSSFNKSDEVKNAELYSHDIIGNLNSGSSGEVDWNMLLDYKGGPNHKKNNCDSHVMLNSDNSSYIKHLSYYYIAHFSKYILPGAIRIAFSKFSKDLDVTAFKNLDNSIVIIILNCNEYSIDYNLLIDNSLYRDNIKPHSIITYIITKEA